MAEARTGPPGQSRVVRGVGEDVAHVIQDNIEDHPQPDLMRRVDQVAQFCVGGRGAGREAGLGEEEVVDAVPVVTAGVPLQIL